MGDKRQRPVCQLRIVLLGIEPEIWRRFQVSSDITLRKLHRVIQVVMGWDNDHPHQFIIGERLYGIRPQNPTLWSMQIRDESGARLRQMISNEGDSFTYEYDFGDSWEHDIEVEKIIPAEEAADTPICLDGERACPPEDCGGPFGYARLQQYFDDPESIQLEEPWSFVVQDFDPEAFDLDEVNSRLRAWRQ